VDSLRLFAGFDVLYELWLEMVVDMVNDTNRAAAERARRKTA
jgi:hypothetical protein